MPWTMVWGRVKRLQVLQSARRAMRTDSRGHVSRGVHSKAHGAGLVQFSFLKVGARACGAVRG